VSNEDFSNYKTIDIFGNEITPSSFNVCRDNLAEVDAQMQERFLESLP